MLAGAGLGDDAALAQPLREHGLSECVVQLVRAGVEQILALQVQLLARREALRERQRRRPSGVRAAELADLRPERLVRLRLFPRRLELVERRDQRLGDVAAAPVAEAARHPRAAST